jgi:hypothetical protein
MSELISNPIVTHTVVLLIGVCIGVFIIALLKGNDEPNDPH